MFLWLHNLRMYIPVQHQLYYKPKKFIIGNVLKQILVNCLVVETICHWYYINKKVFYVF